MGRWCLVRCNCPNRVPLQDSRWGDYACGHVDGAIIAFAPNDLLTIGQDLERIYRDDPREFEIFRKIGNPESYVDEYASLSTDEAALWQMEIEQLQRFLSRQEWMGARERQRWDALREHEAQHWRRSGYDPPDLGKALDDGLALCAASARMNAPIELFL